MIFLRASIRVYSLLSCFIFPPFGSDAGPAEEKSQFQSRTGIKVLASSTPTSWSSPITTPPPAPPLPPPLPKGRRKSFAHLIFHQHQLKNGCLSQHRSLPSRLCSPPRAGKGPPKAEPLRAAGGCQGSKNRTKPTVRARLLLLPSVWVWGLGWDQAGVRLGLRPSDLQGIQLVVSC